jgi:hypothetical protein
VVCRRGRASCRQIGKWVYTFGDGKAEGEAGLKNLLGGKGANLAEMSNLGLPVPPGFTITTEVCTYITITASILSEELEGQVEKALAEMARSPARASATREKPAAGLGALRRARLDAGHDGHRAQSRPERRHRRGARQGLGRCPLRL